MLFSFNKVMSDSKKRVFGFFGFVAMMAICQGVRAVDASS